jgi:hypothetical protein
VTNFWYNKVHKDGSKVTKKIKAISLVFSGVFLGSLVGLLWVINSLDPKVSQINPIIFFVLIFTTIFSISLLIGFNLRQRLGIREQASFHLRVSARQAVWYSTAATAAVVLQSFRILNAANALMLASAIVCLELFFIFNDRKSSKY